MSFVKLPEIFEVDPVFQEADRGGWEPELVPEVELVVVSEAELMKVKLACHPDQE